MQGSLEFGRAVYRPGSYIRCHSTVAAGNGLNISFKFVILFLLMLYSSIAVIYPQLNAVRPALVIGLGAIIMLAIELAIMRPIALGVRRGGLFGRAWRLGLLRRWWWWRHLLWRMGRVPVGGAVGLRQGCPQAGHGDGGQGSTPQPHPAATRR